MATNTLDQKMFSGIVFPAGWGIRLLNDRGKREEWPCVSFSLEMSSFRVKKTLAISAALLLGTQLPKFICLPNPQNKGSINKLRFIQDQRHFFLKK